MCRSQMQMVSLLHEAFKHTDMYTSEIYVLRINSMDSYEMMLGVRWLDSSPVP